MTPWVKRLLVANIAVYALSVIGRASPIWDYLVLIPVYVIERPWTLLTYMFLHDLQGIGHILFNMLVLFFFGPRVEQRLGERRFITLYVIAGLTGGLASVVLTPRAAVVGASAAIYGVMLAFAVFWPRERIYIWGIIPIEARILVILSTLFALYSGFGGGGRTAHFAHLGGYVGAALYLWFLSHNTAKRKFQAKINAVEPGTKRAIALNRDSLNLHGVHELTREEVDRILDKIYTLGMGSITPEELRFLSNFAPMDDRKPMPPS
jgi:membrane associated rhomboid family serine protease